MFGKRSGPLCPLIRAKCVEGDCKFWVTVEGKDPQTGQPLKAADCVMIVTPKLLIENNREVRQAAAATESARNEFVNGSKSIGEAVLIAAAATQRTLIGRND